MDVLQYISIYIIYVKLHYAYENYKEFANIIQDYMHVDYSQYSYMYLMYLEKVLAPQLIR
jgi:hypothetical protein